MSFGRRQQPPGATPTPPPRWETLHAAPSPSLQPTMPDAFNENIVPASKEFMSYLLTRYDSGNGAVHAESMIGAAAALTGEFAQRAGVPTSDGKPAYLVADAVNDVLIGGKAHGRATVWDCIEHAARSAGLAERDIPDPLDIMKKVTAALGRPEFPPLTVPEKHRPHEYSPSACVRLRPGIIAIADRYDLTRRDLCIALGMATGGLVQATKDTLAPAIGVRLAAELAFGVARMAPLNETVE